MNSMSFSPFIAFIKLPDTFEYEAYLVNPANILYERVVALTWGTSSDIDSMIETEKAIIEEGRLEPNSFIRLEKNRMGLLDYVLIYHLDLYPQNISVPVMVHCTLPKGHWEYPLRHLPILEREGMYIHLDARPDNETVEEEAKHMVMESRFITFD